MLSIDPGPSVAIRIFVVVRDGSCCGRRNVLLLIQCSAARSLLGSRLLLLRQWMVDPSPCWLLLVSTGLHLSSFVAGDHSSALYSIATDQFVASVVC